MDSLNQKRKTSRGLPRKDTEMQVCEDILERQERGIAKYGTTVAENPASLRSWLQHQYEELLDAAVYCKRALQELDERSEV